MANIALAEIETGENTVKKYYPKKSKRPVTAIRYFCFECMGWDRRSKDSGKPFEDVKGCTDEMCPLYDFRFGKNPFVKRKISQKTIDALKEGRRKALLTGIK